MPRDPAPMRKKILLGAIVIFLGLQLIRPAPNRSVGPEPQSLAALYPPPPAVKHLLEVACYDCHSNNTRYPWYSQIQPSAWWLGTHIRDGKAELNFSEFGKYTSKRQARLLSAVSDEVTDHSMPLRSYTWIHQDARLNAAQIKLLSDWADGLQDEIASEKE